MKDILTLEKRFVILMTIICMRFRLMMSPSTSMSAVVTYIKCLKKHIDQSPQHYLIHIRMYHASQLFKETDLQSQEIADRVGYKDPLLFSRAFKNILVSRRPNIVKNSS